MNPFLDKLHPYPFEKLAVLTAGVTPPADLKRIAFTIGEPQHAAPQLVLDALRDALEGVSKYPATKGEAPLRQAIADWCARRFGLVQSRLDPERQVLPVNGTREALFAIVQALVDASRPARVVMPNPFYQIYEGAALLAGAQAHYLNCEAEQGFQPDFSQVPAEVWRDTQLVFICSPGNPTGALLSLEQQKKLLQLADEHDFVICADECYSEIYFDEQNPPPGLLQACEESGRHDFSRCLVFHSLSKRSNLPGLRSGFVAGDERLIQAFLKYRTYHGCAMPLHHQVASVAAWQDESHVQANRNFYRAKFDAVLEILKPVMDVQRPDAGFYLWPVTPIDDEVFTRRLLETQNLGVLPGRYLSREVDGHNPAVGRIRIALVAELDECIEGAQRMRRFIEAGC
ncbi:succinyldiaminopimelate transaminase [Marinospirillum alkaliphilum]|uniref:Succinyldiaminopimelate aminotransferase apoenzyme n=1 Tax=Marinospirillum alkaliphilum DSM 21637 TaxID=1122209 RepID=A0A1K1W4L0_9GAMM|nr:succinyldiaminopimelate transaminase [Marinospirillum alkaliphilum]SFX31749.1 succinyldiaminopimelate aminotransferase apoenzyme [Marinospirillum alkaliphilum DSM 21637]